LNTQNVFITRQFGRNYNFFQGSLILDLGTFFAVFTYLSTVMPIAASMDFSDVTGIIGGLVVALIPVALALLALGLVDTLTGGHIKRLLRGDPLL
jgi:hypothetical protein